jgi:dephospho-CoA kinase
LSTASKNRIGSAKADIVLFDGVRWESDVKLVRSFRKNFLIYVTADPKVRYERTKARKQKVGEDLATFDQFLEDEKIATEIYIPEFGKSADFKIENNGTLDDLKSQITKIWLEIRG